MQRREVATDSWIVDAQFDDMLPDWVDAADTVVFVDISPIWKRTVSWSSSVVSFGCSDIWERMNRMRIEDGRAVVR